MRQSRLSGSVEGIMGNHDSYSDFLPYSLAGRPEQGAPAPQAELCVFWRSRKRCCSAGLIYWGGKQKPGGPRRGGRRAPRRQVAGQVDSLPCPPVSRLKKGISEPLPPARQVDDETKYTASLMATWGQSYEARTWAQLKVDVNNGGRRSEGKGDRELGACSRSSRPDSSGGILLQRVHVS